MNTPPAPTLTTVDKERLGQGYLDGLYSIEYGFVLDRTEAGYHHDGIARGGKQDGKTIEEKILFSQPYHTLIAEVIQDLEKDQWGWLKTHDADFIVWAYCNNENHEDPGSLIRVFLIDFPALKEYVLDRWEILRFTSKKKEVLGGRGKTLNAMISWELLMGVGIVWEMHREPLQAPKKWVIPEGGAE